MTVEDAARHLVCAPSKITRIETGQGGVNPRDVRDLAELYRAPTDVREALLALARESRQRGWWHAYGDALPGWFEVYLGLETEASALRVYEEHLIHGLLQTEDYARAVLRAGGLNTDETETSRKVALRMARQQMLSRPDPPQLSVVLDEALLHRRLTGPDAHRAQLRHLADLASRPTVIVQILPADCGVHGAVLGSFTILSFPTPTDPDVVYLEDLTSALYLERATEIDAYTAVFDHLRENALSPPESIKLISHTAESA